MSETPEQRMFRILRERCAAAKDEREKVRATLETTNPELLKFADAARDKFGARMTDAKVKDATGNWVNPRDAIWDRD